MAKKKQQDGKKEHYASIHDIPRASISDIRDQIKLSWKYKQHRGAIVVVGEAGIGKSQVVAQVAKDENAKIYDVRTAHYGLVGTGIPSTKDAQEGFFNLVVPSVFPKPGEKAIMLFEEINQGLQHAISMFFSLVEDRRMFNYVLPDDALVVALMNPASAQYAVTQIENNAALRRRLKWMFAIENYRDWRQHAKSERFHESDIVCLGKAMPCHPDILSYIQQYPKNLYDKEAQAQGRQYICPATVQTVSLDAYVMEKEGIPLDSSFAYTRFAASIGEHTATHLVDYIKDSTTAVKIEDILSNYNKKAKKAIQRLFAKSEHEKINELNMNLLTHMFGEQPSVETAAKNFVDYLEDLTNDMRVSVLTQLKKVADENNAAPYLFELMREVQKYDKWIAIHTSIDEAQTKVDQGLTD